MQAGETVQRLADGDHNADAITATPSYYEPGGVYQNISSGDPTEIQAVYDFNLIKFRKLSDQWRNERNPLSSKAKDSATKPSYQRIIGMGEIAIPYILAELKDELANGEPGDWFMALWAITGENPVPVESRGRIRQMAEAWIQWGSEAGYIDGEAMGAGL